MNRIPDFRGIVGNTILVVEVDYLTNSAEDIVIQIYSAGFSSHSQNRPISVMS